MNMKPIAVFLLFLCLLLPPAPAFSAGVHGIAMHGSPKYPENFKNFDYVNPDAPKGGTLKMSAFGTFDTFNPFVVKGIPATGIGLTFDTLMVSSSDEPFSQYGLVAETIETPAKRNWVAFTLREEAVFSDGTKITPEDVIFSFNILREKGAPTYRHYYGNVDKVEATSENRVLFTFKKGDNRELPLILGQMPILSQKYWADKDFEATTLAPALASGPYKVSSFEAGRYVVYELNKDYWAKDLPVMKGSNNFKTVRYDYYRDTTVAVEAFKSGAFDIRIENEAKKWASAYAIPAVEKGWIVKEEVFHSNPSGMQGFVYNLRRPVFQDQLVREALAYAFDFEWMNKNLFYSLYTRTRSYFDNSDLAATDVPQGRELSILRKHRRKLPSRLFSQEYDPPESDGSGSDRENLKKAVALLEEAGWRIKEGVLRDENRKQMKFEILLDSAGASAWERITLPFVKNLKKLGIDVTVRTVDSAQYKNRIDKFDFDMIVDLWGQSSSPGNEQRYFWGSKAAQQEGSRNTPGIQEPVVDALIEEVISAGSEKDLQASVRALDRTLQWGFYVIPHWHSRSDKIVYWNKFGRPLASPSKGLEIMTWWIDTARERQLSERRASDENPSFFRKLMNLF